MILNSKIRVAMLMSAVLLIGAFSTPLTTANVAFAEGKEPDKVRTQEEFKNHLKEYWPIEEYPIEDQKFDEQASTLAGPTDSLQARIGYHYQCFTIFVCDRVVKDWTGIPYGGTPKQLTGYTQEYSPWIQVFYEMRAGYTGYYSGARLTDVSEPPDWHAIWTNVGAYTFEEGQILEPGHTDSPVLTDNNTGVEAGSFIYVEFTFTSYSPL